MDIPEADNKGEKKEQKTCGSMESSNPNIAIIIIILNTHKVELQFQGKDFQIG